MTEKEEPEIKFPEELTEEKIEISEPKIYESLYHKVINMTIAEKIKLATTGNREARNILLKDTNRLVLQAVVNSPKITEEEVIKICQSRNINDEVLRLITTKKEFMKNYQIKLALTTNPKTPVPIALKLLNYITEGDLRNIAKNKNISTVVSRQARKILEDRRKT